MERGNILHRPSLAQRVGEWAMKRQHRVELDPKEAGLRAMAHASLNIPSDASGITGQKR